jgi:hypothetical protein
MAFGYVTASPPIVARWRLTLAEVAASAAGPRAILWHKEDETAEQALAEISLAFEIGPA